MTDFLTHRVLTTLSSCRFPKHRVFLLRSLSASHAHLVIHQQQRRATGSSYITATRLSTKHLQNAAKHGEELHNVSAACCSFPSAEGRLPKQLHAFCSTLAMLGLWLWLWACRMKKDKIRAAFQSFRYPSQTRSGGGGKCPCSLWTFITFSIFNQTLPNFAILPKIYLEIIWYDRLLCRELDVATATLFRQTCYSKFEIVLTSWRNCHHPTWQKAKDRILDIYPLSLPLLKARCMLLVCTSVTSCLTHKMQTL